MEGDPQPVDQVQMLYIQDGVSLKTAAEKYKKFTDLLGSLSINKHPQSKITIEWKPNNWGVIDSDQEWAFVVKDPECPKGESISIIIFNLEDVKEIETRNKYITIKEKNNDIRTKFYFSHDNADTFVRYICSKYRTTSTGVNLLRIDGPIAPQNSNSLSDIHNAFYDYNPYNYSTWGGAVGNIVRNLKEKPVETAWEAGTKVYGAIFGRDEMPINTDVKFVQNKPGIDDYEIVLSKHLKEKLKIDTSRGHPLSVDQWQSFKNSLGQIKAVDEVKKIIFRGGVDPSIRVEVWKYLLNYFPWDMNNEERNTLIKNKTQEYFSMKKQWKSITLEQQSRFADFHERKSLVEKDVNRTDRAYSFYAGTDNPNLETLHDILMTYVMYNFDLGYVQGMSDLLSPIFNLLRDEVDAFWCFVGFMEKVHSNFDMDQAGMKHQFIQISNLISFMDPILSKYLNDHESANMYFCFRWFLVLFKREFSLFDIMRLWEVLWTGLPCENFHLLVGVAILSSERDTIIEKEYEFSNILKHINDLSMNLMLEFIISKAEEIYHAISAVDPPDVIRAILGMDPHDPSHYSENEISTVGLHQVQGAGSEEETNDAIDPYADDEVSFSRSLDSNFL